MKVLVTGASSGIGRATVEWLASRGHQVLAGARKAADLAELGTLANVTPLKLDVTDPADAQAALQALGDGGLDGLVHNAGIGEIGFFASWSDEDLRRIFEVNVFGVARLTRVLLPRIVQAQGRIVHVGSQGGSITMPCYGPYTMTKHALEAMNESLRQECAPHGVSVSIVQPGAVSTRIGENSGPGTLARLESTPPPFDTAARAMVERMRHPPAPADADAPESAANRKACTPDKVAAVIGEALTGDKPQARYLVGTRWEGDRVLRMLIERLHDAADSPSHRLSRDELIAMVDAQARGR